MCRGFSTMSRVYGRGKLGCTWILRPRDCNFLWFTLGSCHPSYMSDFWSTHSWRQAVRLCTLLHTQSEMLTVCSRFAHGLLGLLMFLFSPLCSFWGLSIYHTGLSHSCSWFAHGLLTLLFSAIFGHHAAWSSSETMGLSVEFEPASDFEDYDARTCQI